MKRFKIAAAVLCLLCILLLSSPTAIVPASQPTPTPAITETDPYENALLHAAEICHKVYSPSPKGDTLNVVLTEDVMESMLNDLQKNGYTAIDAENAFDMRNPEPLIDFGNSLQQADAAEASYLTVYSDGHIAMSILTPTTIRTLSARFTDTPSIYLRTESALTSIRFTEKGWLIYARDPATITNAKQFNVDPHTMVRVTPLSESLRALCRTYIEPVGYSENNLFLTSWNTTCMDSIDFASLYAMLFGMSHNGDTLTWYSAKSYYEPINGTELFLIPAEDFEDVTQRYLQVDRTTLRSIPEYTSSRNGYYFLGWQTGYYSVVPRIPTPEVVDAVYNADGSITMQVDALYSWYGTDKAFTHWLTVLPNADGSFQYLANTIEASEGNIFPDRLLPIHRAAAIKQAEGRS